MLKLGVIGLAAILAVAGCQPQTEKEEIIPKSLESKILEVVEVKPTKPPQGYEKPNLKKEKFVSRRDKLFLPMKEFVTGREIICVSPIVISRGDGGKIIKERRFEHYFYETSDLKKLESFFDVQKFENDFEQRFSMDIYNENKEILWSYMLFAEKLQIKKVEIYGPNGKLLRFHKGLPSIFPAQLSRLSRYSVSKKVRYLDSGGKEIYYHFTDDKKKYLPLKSFKKLDPKTL